jgi:hypothetical protein
MKFVSLGVVVLASASLLLAGCAGSSSPGVAHLSPEKDSGGTSSGGSGPSPESTASHEQAMVTFAKCMRASGVSNFPDPSSGGRITVPTGANPAAPLFKAAQAKCQKLLPGGGLPGSEPPSAHTLAHWLNVSRCMRKHGIHHFPDPTTSVPSKPPAGIGGVADREGAILLFGSMIDQQSSAFTRAAAACGFQLTNH